MEKEYIIPPKTRQVLSVTTDGNTEAGIPEIEEENKEIFIQTQAIYQNNEESSIPLVVSNPTNSIQKFNLPKIKLEAVIQMYVIKKISHSSDRKEKLKGLVRLDHLSKLEKEKLFSLFVEFNEIFFLPGDTLQSSIETPHKITTPEDATPIFVKNYRFPEILRKEVEKQTDNLLQQKIIVPSESPWNAPVWIVPKKADASGKKKFRMVVDYRKLNDITIAYRYPIPNIEDIFDHLGKSKYFSTLDLASGFHQIPIHVPDRMKTAFSTHQDHFEFLKMPFGLKNAPSTFQRIINRVLSGIRITRY